MGILERLDERLERIEATLGDLTEREATSFETELADDGPEYLDTPSAASTIGVSKQSMALWRSKGTGPSYTKVGGTVRYSRTALRQWMKENER